MTETLSAPPAPAAAPGPDSHVPAPTMEAVIQEILRRDHPSFHAALDAVEAALSTYPQLDLPPCHTLTEGLYSRRLFMPAGSIIVSRIHRRQHQFVVLRGTATVLTEEGASRIGPGHAGITEPGTRRLLFIHSDAEWITFHPTACTDMDSIAADLILPRHLLGEISTNQLS